MPRVGLEPAIPMFERPKTVLALDRSAIETGLKRSYVEIIRHNEQEMDLCCFAPGTTMVWR
jgi:hypothetical protein